MRFLWNLFNNMNKKNYFLGVFFILLSTIGFSSLQMIVKLLPDVNVGNKLFFRNVVISLITFLVIKSKGISLKVDKRDIPLLSLRILCGILGVVISFYTLMTIPLASSTIIQKLSSFIMLILSYIFFKEKFTKVHIIALIIAFMGVILIVKPGSSDFSIGYLLAILGAFCAAIAYLSIRGLGINGRVNPFLIVFYFSFISCIIFIPEVIFNTPNLDMNKFILLLLIGVFGAIGQYGITFAYKFASSKEVGVFEYTQIIFSSILGFVFLKEVPDIYSVIGYLIITFTGIYIFNYNKNKN